MLLGFYSGVSGAHYNEEKLGVTSSNLANVDTAGFRRSLMVLRSREENPQSKWIDSDVQVRNPNFYGIQRTGVYKVYKDTGTLKQTQNAFDLAIPPELKNAFFAVKRTNPNDEEIYYTRNGTLSIGPIDASNPNSRPVLRIAGHVALDDIGQPIDIDPTGGSLQISSDGQILQGDSPLGNLPVFRLNKSQDPGILEDANLQRLKQLGDSLYQVPRELAGQFFPMELEIGENGVSRLMAQGMQEGSNVNPINELLYMMEASKGHSANINAISSQMDGLKKLFQLVRS